MGLITRMDNMNDHLSAALSISNACYMHKNNFWSKISSLHNYD